MNFYVEPFANFRQGRAAAYSNALQGSRGVGNMIDQFIAGRVIFGDRNNQVVTLIGDCNADLESFCYHFMPEEDFRHLLRTSADPYEAQSVYCNELIQRAHIAAIASLLRAERWLSGIIDAFISENLYVFAAAFRGFLESSADSHYVLAPVPREISDKAEILHKCLRKIPREEVYIFKELEDRLIHFSHARKIKKPETAADSHYAKTMRYYLDYLEQYRDAGLHEFYSELCEITHPAADSVLCMLKTMDGAHVQLNKNFDKESINSLLKRYRLSTDWLFANCISPALFTLGLINLMNIPELRTSAMERIDLRSVGKWSEFSEKVSRAFSVV